MLEIHFLGTLHGDCTIVRVRGRVTMIDINTEALPGIEEIRCNIWTSFPQPDDSSLYPGASRTGSHARTERAASTPADQIRLDSIGIRATSYHPDEAEVADWGSYDRLRRGQVAETQTLFPVAERDTKVPDRYPLEGWSIIAPDRSLAEMAKYGDFAPPSYIMALDYAGARVMLGGEVRLPLWRRAVRDCGRDLCCTILRASHPIRTPEIDYDAQPYAPALDLMRPGQVGPVGGSGLPGRSGTGLPAARGGGDLAGSGLLRRGAGRSRWRDAVHR